MMVTRGPAAPPAQQDAPPSEPGPRRHSPAAGVAAVAAVLALSMAVLLVAGAVQTSPATTTAGTAPSSPSPGTAGAGAPAATTPWAKPGPVGERATVSVGSEGTRAVALSPDGGTLLVGTYPPASPVRPVQASTVLLLDPATGLSRGSVSTSRGLLGLVVSPDGNRAYATASVDDVVDVIDVPSRSVAARVPTGDFPQGIAIAPDGRTVYVAHHGSGTVVALDTATNTVRATRAVGDDAGELALSPDGSTLAVGQDANISVLDAATLTVRRSMNAGRELISAVAFTVDGRYVFLGTRGQQTGSGEIAILDVAEMRFPRRFTTRELPLAFASGPGAVYASQRAGGGSGAGLLLTITPTGGRPGSPSLGADPAALALSADGRLLYAVDGDEHISVIRVS